MSFIAALALFAAVAGMLLAVRAGASTPTISAADDAPRRAPRPGARDQHALVSHTLGRAPVPSWG